jgi:hypothetical protein
MDKQLNAKKEISHCKTVIQALKYKHNQLKFKIEP